MQVGSYQVLFELARGGMGTVCLARAVGAGGFERLVAIKRAHAGAGIDATATERFLTEARVAAQVHHVNVVSTHFADADAEGHFLVCDYVEGASLAQLIERASDRGERIPPAIALRIAADALAGLHAVHEASNAEGAALGILHRDVSPQNLLVGRDGVTRLSDFGIAKSNANQAITDGQSVMGKLVYLAPEYLQRQPVGRTLDVYALGIVLWVALSGRDPWSDMADAQLVEQITMRGVSSFSALGLGLDPMIEQVVERACRRDASWRYQTARDMHDALEQAGQKAGCLAGQRDVAEYVEQVFGDELSARRERIRVRSQELTRGRARDTQPRTQRSARLVLMLGLGGVGLVVLALLYRFTQQPARQVIPVLSSAPSAAALPARASAAAAPALPSATALQAAGSFASPEPVVAPPIAPPSAATHKRIRRHDPATRSSTPATSAPVKTEPFGGVAPVNPYRKQRAPAPPP